MNAPQKRFVKYTFDQKSTNKPRETYKEKQYNTNPRTQQNTNTRTQHNTSNRAKRYVSYTQKSSLKQNVLKDMINSYIPLKKPSKQILEICKAHPKYFNTTPKQPQISSNQSLNSFLVILGKKPAFEGKNYQPPEIQSQQQPDWDSNSDHQGGIQSKKIDCQLIQKIQQKLAQVKPIRNTDLRRHEKQFLQDYYREKKHLQQVQKQQQLKQQQKKQIKQQADNDWTQYQQKQVQDFVNMGFIQKIQQNQLQEEQGFGSQDFSVQDQKSDKQQSQKAQSSEQQDDVFGDVGPTTLVKKQQTPQSEKNKQKSQFVNQFNQGTVLISSHVFSRIAQQVGIPPAACIWIIKNKNQRYKVSTQFMDQMYRLNNFCQSLPYISLNHSQFVHNNDVQKQKGLLTFKNYNARKHQYNHYYKNYRDNKNDDSKKKFHVKNHKTHLNKK